MERIEMPALFIKMSILPYFSMVLLTTSILSASILTSETMGKLSIPCFVSSSLTSKRGSFFRPVMTIFAPSCPKANANAFPIPDDAPVMITTLFFILQNSINSSNHKNLFRIIFLESQN